MSNKYRGTVRVDDDEERSGLSAGRLPLLVGFLGGPILWSLHLLVSQILIASACSSGMLGFSSFTIGGTSGWEVTLLLFTLAMMLLAIIVGLIALRTWQRSRIGFQVTGEIGGAAGRNGWMGLAGVLFSTFFLIGIAAAGMSLFWLSGCSG
jgi:hypothetical protein